MSAGETNSRAMTTRPDVSILIVTWNTVALTREAISSVLLCPDSVEREVIVIDNASTDGTGECIRSEFPSVRYRRLSENRGFAHANNLAAALASGRILILLNSDATLNPGSLKNAVDYLSAHPECAVLGARLLNPDGSFQNSFADDPTLLGETTNRSLVKRIRRLTRRRTDSPIKAPTSVDSVIGAFMAVRRETWIRLGGFDEAYFFYFEETDFCSRARAAGSKVVHHPSIRVLHHQGSSASAVKSDARIEFWRSRYVYFSRHHGPAINWTLGCILPLRLALSCLFNSFVAPFSDRTLERTRWQLDLLRWHFHGKPPGAGITSK